MRGLGEPVRWYAGRPVHSATLTSWYPAACSFWIAYGRTACLAEDSVISRLDRKRESRDSAYAVVSDETRVNE